MPKNRKYFLHNTVVMVTSRIEEGLPLVPTHFLNEIIWGILARGQALYQVKVCHFMFMANHFHMLLTVDNPEDVSNYVGYIKAEIAHAVNRLLGRRQKTLWCKGYDSPIILTVEDVLRYIDYIYANPVKAKLVSSVNEYPGVSSWNMYVSGCYAKECKNFSRDSIPQLSFASMSIKEQKVLLDELMLDNVPGSKENFMLEPFAWLECFANYGKDSRAQIKDQTLKSINKIESHCKKLRKANKQEVIGSTKLRRQSMLKEYMPSGFGRRMVCLSSDLDLRERFLKFYKELCSFASKVYNAWKLGRIDLRIPPGLLAPKFPVLVSSLSRIT